MFRPPKCQKKEINGENLLKARFYSRRGGNRSYTQSVIKLVIT